MIVEDILCDGGKLSEVIPNYKQRDGQIEMSKAIDDAYKTKKTVILNAPTGNGKSIGGLVPAILNKKFGKTIISTASKSLQDQYQYKDIPILHKILDFKSFVLKGRSNYVCRSKYEESADDVIPIGKQKEFNEWYNSTMNGDFEELPFAVSSAMISSLGSNSNDCLGRECPYRHKCFYLKNKAKAIESDILIVNHDLLALYLILRKERNSDMFGGAYSIIVDEAHKLEDIMTKHMGFELKLTSFNRYLGNVNKYFKRLYELHKVSDEIIGDVENLSEEIKTNMKLFFRQFCSDEDKTIRVYPYGVDIGYLERSKQLINSIGYKIPNNVNNNADKKLKELIEKIDNGHNEISKKLEKMLNMDKYLDKYVYYVDATDDVKYVKFHVSPIDISEDMYEMLFRRNLYDDSEEDFATVTLLSATLFVNRSFDFIKNRLGIADTYYDEENKVCLTELSIKDIFDYKHQCLLYLPKGIIDPINKKTERYVFTNQIVKTIKDLSKIVDGGILSLFTSYYELDQVYNELSTVELDRNILNQKMVSRRKILEEFKQDKDSILMATSSFWEGIDVQGDACSCVIIDKIPFPVPSEPIIEARIDKIKNDGGNWFDDYYLPIAIIALQQGFGRLIRTHKDLGIVVIMDNRLLSKPYGRKILRSLPNCLKTRKIEKVKLFFDIVKQKRKLFKRGK